MEGWRGGGGGDIFTGLPHELLGESEAAVRAHHGQRGDVAVLDAVGRLFFHFGEDVAYDFGWVVGGFRGAGDLGGGLVVGLM